MSKSRSETAPKTSAIGRTFRYMVPAIFSYKNLPNIAASFALSVGTTGFNILSPYLLSLTIQSLNTDEELDVLGYQIPTLVVASLFGVSWTMSSILSSSRAIVSGPIAQNATNVITDSYVNHVIDQSIKINHTSPIGDHVSRLTKAYVSMPNIGNQLFTQILPTGLEVAVATSILSTLYGAPIGIGLATATAVYSIYDLATKPKIIEVRDLAVKKNYKTYQKIIRTLNNSETIQAYNNGHYEKTKLQKSIGSSVKADYNTGTILTKLGLGNSIIAGLGYTSLLIMIVDGISKNNYTIEDFIFISSYLAFFFGPLNSLGSTVNSMLSSLKDMDALFKELEVRPQVIDYMPNTLLNVDRDTAEIEFRNVSFSYDKNKVLLDNVSFKIKPGQKIGIVGVSGSGKTTIVNLILRFYDPTSGDIFINGQNIKDVSIKSLRSNIGLISQTSAIFEDTLYNNIAYAHISDPQNVSEEAIQKVVENVHLDDFVSELPRGLSTMIGEQGISLSGGQVQQVAIARALLKDPKIVIIDEGTSALDNKTEKKVQKSLDTNFNSVTSIVITHRIADIINADKIIFINDGKVLGHGSHKKLLKNNDEYQKLWSMQKPKSKVSYMWKSNINDMKQEVDEIHPGLVNGAYHENSSNKVDKGVKFGSENSK